MTNSTPRVYIDSCYYIDVVRGKHAVPMDSGRALHIPFVEKLLLASTKGEIEVWASSLVIAECLSVEKSKAHIPKEVQQSFISLLKSGSAVKIAAADVFIAERARDLRWEGINCGGGSDQIHVATALELGCEEFITTNRRRGPLNADTPALLAQWGLRVIEAPQTSVLPPGYSTPLLDNAEA